MKLPINIVDAFADSPFKGNQAAVCILDEMLHDSLQQQVAFEMNLSETAFLFKQDDGSYNLRWFTPNSEVDLCGHATLASTHILFEKGICKAGEQVRFNTKSGMLITKKNPDGEIVMDFPAILQKKIDHPKELETALGVTPVYIGRTKWN